MSPITIQHSVEVPIPTLTDDTTWVEYDLRCECDVEPRSRHERAYAELTRVEARVVGAAKGEPWTRWDLDDLSRDEREKIEELAIEADAEAAYEARCAYGDAMADRLQDDGRWF